MKKVFCLLAFFSGCEYYGNYVGVAGVCVNKNCMVQTDSRIFKTKKGCEYETGLQCIKMKIIEER